MAGETPLEKFLTSHPKLTPCMGPKGAKRMQTVTQPRINAKYATVYDTPARIAKVNGALYVIYDDGRIEDFEVEMAPFTVVLGDVTTAETAAMWDRIAGGAARIACSRRREVR
jgi:hypothetical protein